MNKQRSILSAAMLAMALSASASADTVVQWGFESPLTPADATNFAVYPNAIAPSIGSGNASGVHANAATDWTTPVGNGSANSFSSNTWTVGDYYQFQTSTTGFADVMLSWDQTSSSTGPRDFKLAYSTDGTGYTDFGSYSVLVNGTPNTAWTSATYNSAFNFAFDLSAITALDNQANVFFRLTDTSTVSANAGTVATAGTDRVDNFTVSASVAAPIPEADTYALLLAGLGLVGFLARRRRVG
ncbi:MAG: hypothetical protein B7Y41_15630 [Hydrogenophilales bacterium 28-61-23]|nr:MAG: hypothetical protein B7Y41_15630 [Hydrogenophilales bacterium 28-61-23]